MCWSKGPRLKPHLAPNRILARYWSAVWWPASGVILLIPAFFWFVPRAPAVGRRATGRLEGTVSVEDPGHQSDAASVRVLASGPIKIETQTNADGKYVFVGLPPGNYTVEATSHISRLCYEIAQNAPCSRSRGSLNMRPKSVCAARGRAAVKVLVTRCFL